MRDTSKRETLCRQLEQFAAILAVLVRAPFGQQNAKDIDEATGRKIVAAEKQMMSIARELIESVSLQDSDDVSSYVRALNSSRLRFCESGISTPNPAMISGAA